MEALLVLEQIQIEGKTYLGDVKETELKQDISDEWDVSKEEDVIKAVLVITGKKDVLVHKTEIS